MLIDFPDYSHTNPWQVKLIETCAPMQVVRVNELKEYNCQIFHISWEDFILVNFKSKLGKKNVINFMEDFLKNQSRQSKIVWTLHNITSHSFENKNQETQMRDLLMEYSSIIILMSEKHRFMIPEKHQSKIKVIPHFIETKKNIFDSVSKLKSPTFFKYGAPRGDKNLELYNNVLRNKDINKFVSDSNIKISEDNINSFITKRRFSYNEEQIFSQLSNFSMFYRKSNLNSGVLSHYIGKKLVVLHDSESIKYLDLPNVYKKFEKNIKTITTNEILEMIELLNLHDDEINYFIEERSPENISKLFWSVVENL